MALAAVLGVGIVASATSCGRSDPSLRPDSLLQAELGLTDRDRVHTVSITGGPEEVVAPGTVEILPGDWVQFVTTDWRVHQLAFQVDSLSGPARDFLEGSDQVASPPLVDKDARFVVSFEAAPEGRYPFLVEGNGRPVRGVVVVGPKR